VSAPEPVSVTVWGELRAEKRIPGALRVLVGGQHAGAIAHGDGAWTAQAHGLRQSQPTRHDNGSRGAGRRAAVTVGTPARRPRRVSRALVGKGHAAGRQGEPDCPGRLGGGAIMTGTVRRWPLFLIATPAAVSIWSGWVGLGQLRGFGPVYLLPGIADAVRINTAITLPVGVEAYGAYALGAWLNLAAGHPARTFAKRSAIGSLVLGMLGQVAYHVLAAAHAHRAPWPVVVLVACLPVVTTSCGRPWAHSRSRHGGRAAGRARGAASRSADRVQRRTLIGYGDRPRTRGVPGRLRACC